jgi:hypothetical protein
MPAWSFASSPSATVSPWPGRWKADLPLCRHPYCRHPSESWGPALDGTPVERKLDSGFGRNDRRAEGRSPFASSRAGRCTCHPPPCGL